MLIKKDKLVCLDKPIRKMAVSGFIHLFPNLLTSALLFLDTLPGARGSEDPASKLDGKTRHIIHCS